MSEPLHLVRIPLRADKLTAIARERRVRLREVDEGYLCHCLLRELWQEQAPSPFLVTGRGRLVEVLGYIRGEARALIEHARAFGDPALVSAVDDLEAVASKAVPRFEAGRRIGLNVRACPVVRLAKPAHGHRAGAEVDAFLARCFAVGAEVEVSREEVYRDWLLKRIGDEKASGVHIESARIAGFQRERLVRRSQGDERQACRLERPDVRFEAEAVVRDGDRFLSTLGHGIGRHRAFGFGAIMLVPPAGVNPS